MFVGLWSICAIHNALSCLCKAKLEAPPPPGGQCKGAYRCLGSHAIPAFERPLRLVVKPLPSQVVGTAALLVCVLALGDAKNSPAPPGSEPVLVGAAVLVLGVSMGSNSGYALNPARDLGPRLFTYLAGWGAEVFR